MDKKTILIIVSVVVLVGLVWWISQKKATGPSGSGAGFAPASIFSEQLDAALTEPVVTDDYGDETQRRRDCLSKKTSEECADGDRCVWVLEDKCYTSSSISCPGSSGGPAACSGAKGCIWNYNSGTCGSKCAIHTNQADCNADSVECAWKPSYCNWQ